MNDEKLIFIIQALFTGCYIYYINMQINKLNYDIKNSTKVQYLILGTVGASIIARYVDMPERIIVAVCFIALMNKVITKNSYIFSVMLSLYAYFCLFLGDVFSGTTYCAITKVSLSSASPKDFIAIDTLILIFIAIFVKLTKDKVADMEKNFWSNDKRIGAFAVIMCIPVLLTIYVIFPIHEIILNLPDQESRGHKWEILLFSLLIVLGLYLSIAIHLVNIYSKNRELAQLDLMTGTINKGTGINYIEECMDRARIRNKSLILCFVDVDNLKTVNDTYGHNEGDVLIKTVADTIKKNIRKIDKVIRFGGDEFIIVFKNTNKDVVEEIVERINNKLADISEIKSYNYKIGISYGFAEYFQGKDGSVHDFIEEADKNMYQFKKRRKEMLNLY